MKKCLICDEELEQIYSPDVGSIWISPKQKERISLYVCTSRDCKNCGIVFAIPWKEKDE